MSNLQIDKQAKTLTMTRVFDAPRELMYNISTDPTLIPRWWGPKNITTTVDRFEFKVGGVWRYVQKDQEGNEYAFNGVYKEIIPNEKITNTFEFKLMPGHILTETIVFEEVDGKTRLTTTSQFDTLEDLEGMVASGMESGATESWDQLEALVMEMK